jgi:restriction endonuclease S subunit
MKEKQNGSALPKDWSKVAIPDIIGSNGIFVDGDWIESKDQDPSGDVRLIQLADIGDGKFRNKSSRFLTSKRANEINCTFLSEGDILLARMPDPIGRACIFPLKGNEKYVTAVDIAIIRPDDEKIDRKYLLYVINNPKFRNAIEELQSGTTRKRISRKNLSTLKFPLPPKLIQKAIVSKIEELFSELDKGIEQLKTAHQQLKTYRQSVLKRAFDGRLTNENLKEGELPIGWKNVKVSDVANINPKLPNRETLSKTLEVQFIPMKLVEEIINKIHLNETRRLKEVQKGSYTPFVDGDIIFAKVTPCMENGKIAIVENLKNGIGYGSSEFHVVRCLGEVLKTYLFYFLVQDIFRSEAENAMTGAVGLRRVPKQFIENHDIPL